MQVVMGREEEVDVVVVVDEVKLKEVNRKEERVSRV